MSKFGKLVRKSPMYGAEESYEIAYNYDTTYEKYGNTKPNC